MVCNCGKDCGMKAERKEEGRMDTAELMRALLSGKVVTYRLNDRTETEAECRLMDGRLVIRRQGSPSWMPYDTMGGLFSGRVRARVGPVYDMTFAEAVDAMSEGFRCTYEGAEVVYHIDGGHLMFTSGNGSWKACDVVTYLSRMWGFAGDDE